MGITLRQVVAFVLCAWPSTAIAQGPATIPFVTKQADASRATDAGLRTGELRAVERDDFPQRGHQFIDVAAGPSAVFVRPEGFVWKDSHFAEGITPPSRQHGGVLDISAGSMVARRAGIVAGVGLQPAVGHVRNDAIHVYAGAQGWVSPRLWVRAAVGPSRVAISRGSPMIVDQSARWGLGLLGAVGFNVIDRRRAPSASGTHFIVHVQGRVTSNMAGGLRITTASVLAGFGITG